MKEPTESQEQRALIQWASYTINPTNQKYKIIDHLIHIPNEGKRSLISGYNMKLMGLKSGVSDLFFAYPIHPYSGLWIELKTLKGKISELQYDFLQEEITNLLSLYAFEFNTERTRKEICATLYDRI